MSVMNAQAHHENGDKDVLGDHDGEDGGDGPKGTKPGGHEHGNRRGHDLEQAQMNAAKPIIFPDANRAELTRLLQGDAQDEWRITETALRDGRLLLPSYRGHFGAYAINLFILDLLRANFPMHSVVLGSGALGCVLNTQLADGRPL